MPNSTTGEQERRSGHLASAEEYQGQWEEAIAEVKLLLPLVRKSVDFRIGEIGVATITSERPMIFGRCLLEF